MSDYILFIRKISDIEGAIMALKELIKTPPSESTDEQIKEIEENLDKLEAERDQLDDDRHYLISPDENNKVIIDFLNRFGSYNLETVYKNGQDLIEVRYQDGNETDCVCVLDYKGIEVVPECVEYKFAGNEVLVLQPGYMLGYEFYNSDNLYWSVAYSNSIYGAQAIEYLKEFQIFLVNESECYDHEFELIGNVENFPDSNEDFLIFKKDNLKGLIFKSAITIEAKYRSIKLEDDEKHLVFRTKTNNQCGIIITDTLGSILFEKDVEADDNKILVFYNQIFTFFKAGEKFITYAIDYDTFKIESEWLFDNFYIIDIESPETGSCTFAIDLYLGIDKRLGITTVFATNDLNLIRVYKRINSVERADILAEIFLFHEI